MARLVGFIGNRPDLGSRAIAVEGSAFELRRPTPTGKQAEDSCSWGVGFYQGGEILLKRRPYDDRRTIGFGELTKDIKADVLVGHIRLATVGAHKTENTHPFRYRQWLFAQTGTVPQFEALRGRLRESLPQFLARDVRGDTDAELVFYLFLSFLHDAGDLDRPSVSTESARAALRSTISLVDRLCAQEGAGETKLNMVVACGDYVIGVRGAGPMAFELVEGREGLEKLFGSEGPSRLKVPHLVSNRLAVVASDFVDDRVPSGWTPIDTRATVTLSRTDDPVLEGL
ncbi:MAG: class II glutamine amidotransferase [Polyangiaceae bacterium]